MCWSYWVDVLQPVASVCLMALRRFGQATVGRYFYATGTIRWVGARVGRGTWWKPTTAWCIGRGCLLVGDVKHCQTTSTVNSLSPEAELAARTAQAETRDAQKNAMEAEPCHSAVLCSCLFGSGLRRVSTKSQGTAWVHIVLDTCHLVQLVQSFSRSATLEMRVLIYKKRSGMVRACQGSDVCFETSPKTPLHATFFMSSFIATRWMRHYWLQRHRWQRSSNCRGHSFEWFWDALTIIGDMADPAGGHVWPCS